MSYIKDFEDSRLMEEIGVEDIESLFSDIPEEAHIDGLDLPDGLPEWELKRKMDGILAANRTMLSFLGGGAYQHHIPTAVGSILSRGEFFTSYTPYQPEISQGMLQSIFEYQSQICELTGMEVSNASLYDASTGLGEAALMSSRISRKTEFIIPAAIAPEKKNVLHNYIKGAGMTFREVPFDPTTGQMDIDALKEMVSDATAGVYIESPNYFGVLEESVPTIKELLPKKTLLTVGINPISLGIIEPPGNFGADIVIGDGQPLGIPVSLGGPYVGIFAARKKAARKMPGRVIGMTRDSQGDRAFAMTLMTREQHITRERATSNICSNQALCALAAGVYLALAGRSGLRTIALINLRNAHHLAAKLNNIPGVTAPMMASPFFNEFTVKFDNAKAVDLREALVKQGIEPGIPLASRFPGIDDAMIISTTEVHTSEDHDRLVGAIREYLS
jgi:glycine dehydrogenase subunit 1